MDKYDYIESILEYIRGRTGINYQMVIKEILRSYYKYMGKTYEMPAHYGGDQKNDGWVVEDAIFYQIYAPTQCKQSLKRDIQKKFITDLTGLINIVYNEKKWNGKINEFIFIVNTFDCNLPHDSGRFFERKVAELKKLYKIDFSYKVVNNDYIRDILTEINDIEVLKQISSALHVKGLIDFNAITEKMMMDLIMGISANIAKKSIGKHTHNYERISTPKKIEINNLEEKRIEIENIISNLDVVEKTIELINQDISCENKFERVKNFVIEKYNELSKEYQNVELYENLINEIHSDSNFPWDLDVPTRYLIVYIFDKCDIFEKE